MRFLHNIERPDSYRPTALQGCCSQEQVCICAIGVILRFLVLSLLYHIYFKRNNTLSSKNFQAIQFRRYTQKSCVPFVEDTQDKKRYDSDFRSISARQNPRRAPPLYCVRGHRQPRARSCLPLHRLPLQCLQLHPSRVPSE